MTDKHNFREDGAMQSPILTNVLLSIIAVFLLVLIVQNSRGPVVSNSYTSAVRPTANPHQSSASRNPSVAPDSPMMAASMYFQAMSAFPEGCQGRNNLLECDSPAALKVKEDIGQAAQSGKGPRQVFDYIIEKYGMAALTPEAQRIRSMRAQ